MTALRLALAQLNLTVGDIAANARRVADAMHRARAWLADLLVVPELALTGYPPEDLLLKPSFVEANLRALRSLLPASHGLTAVVGFVDRAPDGRLSNCAALLCDRRWIATYRKQCLPNYGVFDEKRYFAAGTRPVLFTLNGARIGLTICEDLWEARPSQMLAQAGCRLLLNLSASPYHAGKLAARERLFSQRARANRFAVASCNLVGGQDELVFDGGSLILDARGRLLAQGAQLQEDLLLCDLAPRHLGAAKGRTFFNAISLPPSPHPHPLLPRSRRPIPRPLAATREVYEALVLGLRDYVRKNGFATVVLGLSGGIDSSLTACLAVDALGPQHVVGVVMPSRFSSAGTQADAHRVGRALGIRMQELSIEPLYRAYLRTLRPVFAARAADVTEQNVQARIRGNLLMALSNTFGWLVLTTGNKSEMATGYTTLYGDMAGGLAVIKDVPKTLVYALARFRNRRGPERPIPDSVFRRAPTAELAPHQRDQDTLPPYATLDRILQSYVEADRSLGQIVARTGASPATVRRVIRMVDHAEYKRRQGPPGIKITPRAFGKDRRMPITNRYHQG